MCVCVTEAYGLLFSGEKWSKHIKAKCPKCYRFAPIYSCDFLLIFCGSSWLFSPHRCCTSFIRWRVLRYEHMIAELRGHGLMLDSDPRWWAVCSSWVAGSIEPHLQRKLELQGMWTVDILWQKRTLGLLEDIGSIQTKIGCSFDWSLQLQNGSASS